MLAAYLVVAAGLTMLPGPDFAVTVRTALAAGRRAAIACAAGINAGCLVWGLASAFGVTALLSTSHAAFVALRLAGAAYLVWLGVGAIRSAGPALDLGDDAPRRGRPVMTSGRAFRQGFVTNLLNPKIGVFYLTVLPAFIPAHANVLATTLLYVAIHDAMGLLWLSGVACAVHAARRVLGRERVRRTLGRATGTALIGFGAAVALETR